MIGFVTTGASGVSSITNTSPAQSIVSDTLGASCLGEIAIFTTGTTTTIDLSTLPVASTFQQETGAQTMTMSGTPVVYSPTTLPGYDNTEPIEISTSFVETVNGQTTTQWGWWLIGPHGHIDPPRTGPWRTGPGNFGCIGGLLLCHAPCGDVDVGGGWFVHIPFAKCNPGISGPPGWPGGPIVVGSGGPDDVPPYPTGPEDPGNDDPDDCDEDGIECSKTTTSMTPSSLFSQTSSGKTTATMTPSSHFSQTSSGTTSKTAYFLIAATNAVQSVIEQELRDINSEPGGSYEPDVDSTEFSGGTWIDVDLTPFQAFSMSSRSDIEFVMTCASATFFSADPIPTTVSAATTVTLATLTVEPTSPASRSRNRRLVSDGRQRSYGVGQFRGEESAQHLANTAKDLSKRDAGTLLVRQLESAKDLSVHAWAPGVPSIAQVDYIMQQTKGEFTWVYVVDRGVDDTHWEFQDNWEGIDGFGKVNIDPDWVWAPGMAQVKQDPSGHGTCMASKVCGRKSGVAKQTIVIPAVFDSSYQSCIAVLEELQNDIKSRRDRKSNQQALPGKTVVSISWGFYITDADYVTQIKNALQGIMNLGVVVVVSAGNAKLQRGFVSYYYPEVLALLDDFPLIRVGAVDESGLTAYFSQEGDVYVEGVAAKCAAAGFSFFEKDVDGTSGATAAFAGLVAYMMGLETVPFAFGSDKTQYQVIVKDYFVTGTGAYVRPGGDCRVAWNGLDGSAKTVCPLSLRKRQEQLENICQSSSTSSSIIPTQTPNSITEVYITIYYSTLESCDTSTSDCDMTYYVYATERPGGLPIQECGGALGQGSNSVQFQLDTLAGISEDFTYSTISGLAGTITGKSLVDPITCTNANSQAVAWTCPLTKRSVYPDTTPHNTAASYFEWATCEWNVS